MSKTIFCVKCHKFLGEIHEAKLRKDIVYLCKNCNTQREALELRYKDKTGIMNTFNDIFGGKL